MTKERDALMANSATNDMTQGSPLRLILGFAIPLMLGNFFQQFYNLADTVIVGRAIGVDALAAVGSVGSLYFLVIGFVNGTASGFAIPLARSFGAKDFTEMRRYAANTVRLAVLFSVLFTGIMVALCRSILVWTNTPADIIDLSDAYIRTIFWGLPVTMLYNTASAVLRALGDSRRPFYFLLVAAVLNIGLDLAFILCFGLGVFGAALATVLSQAVAGFASLAYIVRRCEILHWTKEEGRFSARHCAELCRMGLPMGLQYSITALGSVALQGAVNGLGSAIVAAQAAGSKSSQLLTTAYHAIGATMTTYCSQNLGARKLDRVALGEKIAHATGAVYSFLAFLLLRVFSRTLAGLFVDSSETAILSYAEEFLFWNSALYIFLSVLIIYRYSIQGLGYSGLAVFAGVFEMVARALVGAFLVPKYGYWAVCIANPIAWGAACVFLVPAYFAVLRKIRGELQSAA